MSKYHSTITRRDFMKGLGLAGAGLGAAAAAAPVFHDLDALAASPKANYKQPWWVKDLEIEKPSNQVDWTIMPSDWKMTRSLEPGVDAKYDLSKEIRSARNEEIADIREQGLKAGTPGHRLLDLSLKEGAGAHRMRGLASEGPDVTTPEKRGVPKWTGTKEEATKIVRAAAHFFGTPKIGVIEITPNIRKITSTSNLDRVPTECKWILVYLTRQPSELTKMGGISGARLGSTVGYSTGPIIQLRLQAFMKSLGYQAHALSVPAQNVAAGALCGTGELCRISHQITHEYGPIIRYTPTIVTDLPLAPTKPIDAGMFRFCKDCMICAENCQECNGQTPLSLEREPSYEVSGPWNRPGVKAFQIYWPRCSTGCPYCQAVCPFATHNMSHIHELVKAISATTPIFNSFFTNLEHAFGYGLHDSPEEWDAWWNRDLNTWPYDNILGAGNNK